MSKAAPEVKVELAEGVKGDLVELLSISPKATEADLAEVRAAAQSSAQKRPRQPSLN